MTFPAPVQPDRGVRLVQPEGFYDRGKSRTNEGEAKAIVAEIVQRLTASDPEVREHTIGVVTFNSEQQSLIEDLLDEERSRNSTIEWAFAEDCTEPVFVKNLETVQGDERDVILFSVTYGPDRAGNVYMNFGPLNREGGERRLNVAMTRARTEMVVFSTLHPDKIDLSRSSARAVADLKHFLEYAERGPEALGAAVHGSLGDFESPFESAVAAGLRERGWTIHPQIGVSAFRVDLGVVHSDLPGVYLAGVECDGAMYHSSAYARERDKIRQAVLEGLGWTLFRVWSTEWWINKAAALEALDRELQEHLEADRASRAREADNSQIGDCEAFERESTRGDGEDAAANASLTDGRAKRQEEEEPSTLARVASFRGATSVAEAASQGTSEAETGEEREQPAQVPEPSPGSFSRNTPYVRAEIAIRIGSDQLGEMSPARLVDPVTEIVKVESPIHAEDVIRRVTHAAGLQRAGARIQKVVRLAIGRAGQQKKIRRKKDFLWTPERHKIVVRDRSDVPQQDKKFERVAPEEVAQALIDSVERNFSLSTMQFQKQSGISASSV